ncbi:HAD-IB family phosphatase [uncultured Pontibacter sp.]|uniref:HAD-IB family phosphatase n=1 Tax=uncultured Pontibacter sp. TaxID=453356 RepID=UPI002621CA32|nr:HAD-IB family phosphatase [uncultured Pontibacter sp.]
MAQATEDIKVIVFDLNGTFYNKSSKDEFFKFVISKKPKQARYYVQMVYYKLLHKLNQIRQTEFKENFFNYLDNIPPKQVEAYADEFWEREYPSQFNEELLNHFETMRAKGVELFCATGGLELYVKPLFKHFKVDGFAGTRVTYEDNTYKVIGKACKDEEKLCRLAEHYKNKAYTIVEAYSDSKENILDEAKEAYLVQDGDLEPYKKHKK